MNYTPEVTQAIEDTENALIGSILIEASGGTIEFMKQVTVEPGDFRGYIDKDPPDRWPVSARIFYAMTKCELPPHIINVSKKMADLNILHDGDIQKMHYAISITPTCLDLLHYAKAVKEYSLKRQGIIVKPKIYEGLSL